MFMKMFFFMYSNFDSFQCIQFKISRLDRFSFHACNPQKQILLTFLFGWWKMVYEMDEIESFDDCSFLCSKKRERDFLLAVVDYAKKTHQRRHIQAILRHSNYAIFSTLSVQKIYFVWFEMEPYNIIDRHVLTKKETNSHTHHCF